MAACVEASVLNRPKFSCPPLHHGLNRPSSTPSKARAMAYIPGRSHSSLFCCSRSLKNLSQYMNKSKCQVNRRGSIVSAGMGGFLSSVEMDSGTGLLSRSSKDVDSVIDYSANELIRGITGSPSKRYLYKNFVDEMVGRMESVLQNDHLTSAEDYKQRAYFFTKINEIFVALRNTEDIAIASGGHSSSASVVSKGPFENAERSAEITALGGESSEDEMEEEVLTLEDLLMEHDDGTGAADYNRRAAIFGWSAELVAARNAQSQTSTSSLQIEERIRKFEDVLVQDKDNGRAASDYSRRAAIFGKNAELLVAASQKRAEKKRLGCC